MVSRCSGKMKMSDFSVWIFKREYGIINKTLPDISERKKNTGTIHE